MLSKMKMQRKKLGPEDVTKDVRDALLFQLAYEVETEVPALLARLF